MLSSYSCLVLEYQTSGLPHEFYSQASSCKSPVTASKLISKLEIDLIELADKNLVILCDVLE